MESDHLEFYKEVYYKELERRNNLNTEIALQGTTLVAILSGLFFLLTNLKSDHAWLHYLFTVLVAAETAIAAVAVFYIMRSYYDFANKGRRFGYLPTMRAVDDYYQQVDRSEFNSFLKDSFIAACDTHIGHNDHKSVLLTRASRWMTFLMMGGALITLVFIGNYLIDNPNVKTTGSDGIQKPKQSTAAATRKAPTTARASTGSRAVRLAPAAASGRGTRRQDTVHAEVKQTYKQ